MTAGQGSVLPQPSPVTGLFRGSLSACFSRRGSRAGRRARREVFLFPRTTHRRWTKPGITIHHHPAMAGMKKLLRALRPALQSLREKRTLPKHITVPFQHAAKANNRQPPTAPATDPESAPRSPPPPDPPAGAAEADPPSRPSPPAPHQAAEYGPPAPPPRSHHGSPRSR